MPATKLFLISSLAAALSLPIASLAQLTGGKEPNLPKAFAVPSIDNPPQVVPAPEGFRPKVPDGFEVSVFAPGVQGAALAGGCTQRRYFRLRFRRRRSDRAS